MNVWQYFKISMKHFDFIKKAQKPKRFSHLKNFRGFPKSHALAITTLGISLLLFSTVSPSFEAGNNNIEQNLTLFLSLTSTENGAQASTAIDWQTETVKSGDNLSLIFQRAGLSENSLHELLSSSKAAKTLTSLHPGQQIDFYIVDNKLEALRYRKDNLNSVEFKRNQDSFTHSVTRLTPDTHTAYREAVIVNSLFLAGTNAGLEEQLIMELASIFGWDIDFALDIRANDSFKVLFEERFLNGEKLSSGPILAAEFTNQGKTFRAVRYTNSNGESNYYTPEGKSMRKAFLRTPVDFARISSHFNLKRKHPILNKIRAHKGTDYAAPSGTPIKAAGDGKVVFAGTKGGYGHTVIIQHGQSYKTLYAHMKSYGRGIRTGKQVRQGQIIGYVGASGLATGPHLHYEFHVNGSVRNPVSVRLPQTESIAKRELKNFKYQTQPLVAKLEAFSEQIQVASVSAKSSDNTN